MNRRKFCKIATLGLGAFAVGSFEALGGESEGVSTMPMPVMPRDCRVKVLRKECHIDLQAQYLDDPESGACRRYEGGEEFRFTKGEKCTDGFCPALWRVIAMAATSLPCPEGQPHEDAPVIVGCPDGTRPVIAAVRRGF